MSYSRPFLLPTIKQDALSLRFSERFFFPFEVNSETEEVQKRTDCVCGGKD